MSSGMPELGSKISLISKADIRYEGRLFTVDPQECTIALASVRSFGTEDRETQFPVAPQNQVYDYILFRGTDIKDIRVVNNAPQVPNDPAIMQLSVPPQMGPNAAPGYQPQQPPPQQQYNHPVVGPYYHPMGAPRPTMKPSELGDGLLQHQHHPMSQPMHNQPPIQQTQAKDQGFQTNSMLDLISGGSNNNQILNHSRSATPTPVTTQRKSPTADQGTQVGPSGHKDNRRQQQQQHQQNQNQRYRTNSRNRNQEVGSGSSQGQQQQMRHGQPQAQASHQQHQQYHHNNQQSHYQGNQYNNRGWRSNRGGRGGMRGRWPQRSKTTLKFDSEYDFEQANTQFEELRSQLGKIKIDGDVSVKGEKIEGEKKEDSGNETGGAEAEVEDDSEKAYDKTKSFFDNISCEAVERQKGRSQRTDWRAERKLNSETFGVASTRRGNWRGRYNWRAHQGWRGRNNNRNQINQPQQQQRPRNDSQPAAAEAAK